MQNIIKIKMPIWKTMSIGIAQDKLEGLGIIKVKILYKDKKGNFRFPGLYGISTERARTYPTMVVGRHTTVHIIPIKDFTRLEA